VVEVVAEEEERRNLPRLQKNLIKNWIPTWKLDNHTALSSHPTKP
jgi:hypothetical protein